MAYFWDGLAFAATDMSRISQKLRSGVYTWLTILRGIADKIDRIAYREVFENRRLKEKAV
jgi:hypothetical protein